MKSVVESHLIVEDLPEALFHSIKKRQNNMTSFAIYTRGSMDQSLLSSLQMKSQTQMMSQTSEIWFKGILVSLLVILLVVLFTRIIICRKDIYKTRYRVLPQASDQPLMSSLSSMQTCSSSDHSLQCHASFSSLSIPLLKEVSEVWSNRDRRRRGG